jgi:DNA glycosylase AlkZ-like
MPRPGRLSAERLRRARVAAQLLDRPGRSDPAEVVRRLLAVQAQVLSAAGLALAARTEGLSREAVDAARLEDRSLVLTWAMRGTLHLVTAEDYGWLRPLVLEPRIANAHRRLRQLGLTGDQPAKAERAVERMLGRDGPLTRQEILVRLRRLGFPTADEAVAYHLVWLAASEGGVCYGPTRGGDRRFVLVRDWIGETKSIERDAALAELAVRYLTAHGPAAPEDLAFWSGIRIGDVRRGWRAIADRLVEVEAPGATLWTLGSVPKEAPTGIVRLLPNFDEYLLGWKDRGFAVEPARWKEINRGGGWLHPVVLVDGRAAGTWKGERGPKSFRVDVRPFGRLSPAVRAKVAAEADWVGAFLGAPAETTFGLPISPLVGGRRGSRRTRP